MKTLAQVEPRIPISAANYTITQSGSYFLTTNIIAASGQSGIVVMADDVTLDLNGFTLSGAGTNSGLFGIYQGYAWRNLRILNGSIVQWGKDAGAGISVSGDGNWIDHVLFATNVTGLFVGPNCKIGNCVVAYNGYGLRAGPGSAISACLIYKNIQGIVAESGCLVKDCVASENDDIGIWVGAHSVVVDCTASYNAKDGIFVNSGGRVNGCTASWNMDNGMVVWDGGGVQDCAVAHNGTNGISVASSCRVADCEVTENGFQGIVVNGSRCVIVNNLCDNNVSSGIFIKGKRNRVESNHVVGNDFGIYFYNNGDLDRADNNIAMRNTSANNTTANFFVGISNWVANIDTTGSFSGANDNYSLP
jgi:parallel beta-helix repeat protein